MKQDGGAAFPGKIRVGFKSSSPVDPLEDIYDYPPGLTARAYIATHILAGRIGNSAIHDGSERKFAAVAVRLADALIAELELTNG